MPITLILPMQDSADERLACQTAIVTRRGRRASAAVVQRFGDWYNGDDGEVRTSIARTVHSHFCSHRRKAVPQRAAPLTSQPLRMLTAHDECS